MSEELTAKWGSMLELARTTFSGLTSYGTPHAVPVITTVRDPIEHGLSLFSQQHGWRYFVPNQWQVQRLSMPQGRLSRVFPGGRVARCARAWMDGIFQTVSKFTILAQPTDSVPIWADSVPRSDGAETSCGRELGAHVSMAPKLFTAFVTHRCERSRP